MEALHKSLLVTYIHIILPKASHRVQGGVLTKGTDRKIIICRHSYNLSQCICKLIFISILLISVLSHWKHPDSGTHYLFFFFFATPCGLQDLSSLCPPQWKGGVQTTRPPGNSWGTHYLLRVDFLRGIPHELIFILFYAILHHSFCIPPLECGQGIYNS